MPALDLSLCHGMIGLATGVRHALAIEPIGQVSCKIGWTIVAEQAWPPLIAVDLIEPRGLQCQLEGGGHIGSRHGGAELPGNDVTGEVVEHCRQIEPAPNCARSSKR